MATRFKERIGSLLNAHRKARASRYIIDFVCPVDACEDKWVPDGAAFHQIDGSAEEVSKGVCQAEEMFEGSQVAAKLEINPDVSVAGVRVKIRGPGG